MAYELILPDIGEGLTEAEVLQWLVAPGEAVTANQPLVEIETDKAVVEIPAPQTGVLLHQGAAAGTVIRVGELLAVIGAAAESWTAPPAEARPAAAAPHRKTTLAAPPTATGRPRAVPLVRKLAAELGVDLDGIVGTGATGQITRDDVLAAAGGPAPVTAGAGEEQPLSKLRRTIAENMVRSWQEIPHVTVWGPAEATRLLAVRAAGGVSIDALLVEAVLPALARFPVFNAHFDGSRLTVRNTCDIGIAVDTEAGLMVPVLRDAAAQGVATIDKEISRLVAGALDRTLTRDELRGQSFTISNVGAVGGGYGTPIIPHGTTAVLSVGRARDEVVARDGRPVVAPMLPLALSFDHRVIDGSTGTRFLNHVIESIESLR